MCQHALMVDAAPPATEHDEHDEHDEHARDYDVVVVGSGFGGSVAALRLTEKGYRVAVLEAGRRFADHEFASSWHLRTFLWAPALVAAGSSASTCCATRSSSRAPGSAVARSSTGTLSTGR